MTVEPKEHPKRLDLAHSRFAGRLQGLRDADENPLEEDITLAVGALIGANLPAAAAAVAYLWERQTKGKLHTDYVPPPVV